MQTPSPSLIIACHYDLLLLNSQGDSFECRVLDLKHRRIKAVVVLRKGGSLFSIVVPCPVEDCRRRDLEWWVFLRNVLWFVRQSSWGALVTKLGLCPSSMKELLRDRFRLFFSFLNVLTLHDTMGRVLRTVVWQHWVSQGGI
jgi:hypothetical protein